MHNALSSAHILWYSGCGVCHEIFLPKYPIWCYQIIRKPVLNNIIGDSTFLICVRSWWCRNLCSWYFRSPVRYSMLFGVLKVLQSQPRNIFLSNTGNDNRMLGHRNIWHNLLYQVGYSLKSLSGVMHRTKGWLWAQNKHWQRPSYTLAFLDNKIKYNISKPW